MSTALDTKLAATLTLVMRARLALLLVVSGISLLAWENALRSEDRRVFGNSETADRHLTRRPFQNIRIRAIDR
jgi:hypothetical protein